MLTASRRGAAPVALLLTWLLVAGLRPAMAVPSIRADRAAPAASLAGRAASMPGFPPATAPLFDSAKIWADAGPSTGSSGGWWSRRTRAQKILFVAGLVVGAYAIGAAVSHNSHGGGGGGGY